MKDYIVVHDGVFHADDVYAVALAKLFNLKGSDNIIRTRNVDVINHATYELDVGGFYDNQRCFDHHQSLFNGFRPRLRGTNLKPLIQKEKNMESICWLAMFPSPITGN